MTLHRLRPLLAAALVALAAPVFAAPSGKPLYRWVDENGVVHYGDKVPASEAKKARDTLKDGRVTKRVAKQLEGEELKREQARQAELKAAEDARHARLAHDRFLLQSFASVADLQDARELHLASLDGRLRLAEKAVEDNEKTLADLRARTAGKPALGALKTQIESFETSLIDNIQAVRKLRDERTATVARFTGDIERFKGLRAGSIKQGDP